MPQPVEEITETYFAEFARLQCSAQTAWFEPIRKEAMERFGDTGFPTTRQEDWRFTNLSALSRTPFHLPAPIARRPGERNLKPHYFKGVAGRITFIDGVYDPKLSDLKSLPDGLAIRPLASALIAPSRSLEDHLARHADSSRNPFTALNTALFQDGAFVEIADGITLEMPVHLLFMRSAKSAGTVTCPRVLVVAGRESKATVIESHSALSDEIYFTNAVTELVAGENSSLEHLKIQEESEGGYHIGAIDAVQSRSSRLLSHSVSLGSALARHDITSVLSGEGAECTLNGLYQVAGTQHVDHHTRLDHAEPHCSSREYYRGILDGRSSGVFSGAIIVRKDAQKTDAIQSNKNLLLSEEATINTKPELQILADDVRCTHGATVGQLNPDAVFYLRARGIGLEAARHLLTRAFANDVIGRVSFAPARERLETKLLERLSAGWKREEVL